MKAGVWAKRLRDMATMRGFGEKTIVIGDREITREGSLLRRMNGADKAREARRYNQPSRVARKHYAREALMKDYGVKL